MHARHRLRLSVWVLVAVFAGIGEAWSGMVPAVTQDGLPADVDIIQFGRVTLAASGAAKTVGEDSEGGKVQRTEGSRLTYTDTDQVPLKIGEGFGFRIKIPMIIHKDALAIDVIVSMPSVSIDMTVDRSEVRGRLVYDESHAGEIRNITWMFSSENTRYHNAGEWRLSLYNQGKLLVTRPFTVVADAP